MKTQNVFLFYRLLFSYRLRLTVRCFFLSCLLCLTACTIVPRERVFSDFVIVRTNAEDDFPSLAARYLNDPEKGWQIAEFNNIASLRRGQELVIPLRPFQWGGLKTAGYQTVPVLAYHGFSKDKSDRLTVTEAAFKEQMRYLKENDYHVITLDQLLDFLDFKRQVPEKSVVITFDDGRQSIYHIAFPVLRDFGFPASLFISTDLIGGEKALSWKQIKELAENGFDVQSKTRTNRDMTKLKKGESFEEYFRAVQTEISQSKKIIEKKVKKQCIYMAYPYGWANSLVAAVLKKEGYRGAFTQNRGSNPIYVDKYLINRSVIHGGCNLKQFRANLSVFNKSELK